MRGERSLRSSAVLLGAAGAIEFVLQMAIPMLLARTMDENAFAQYRLLWLLAGTVLAIAPMFMPHSLYFFLNRGEGARRDVYAGNVMVFLLVAGVLAALAASGLNPGLQKDALALYHDTAGLSAVFLAFWVMASILDTLPIADKRAGWQAASIIGLALLRTVLLAAAALLSGDILWIAGVMLLVAAAKLLLALLYLWRYLGAGFGSWDLSVLKRQLVYAFPFALGHALFLLRVQADQWVVVSLLPAAMYAAFSVAAVILPVSTLIRQPVNNALLPRLNQEFGKGDRAQAARLIALSNGASGLVLIPVAGGLLACAPELVELIYTSRYSAAAPVMQVYLVGMMISAVAVGHTLSALGHGRLAAVNNGCCLLLGVALSIAGIHAFGMPGAAAGSMAALAIGELWNLAVVARTLGTSAVRLVNWRALLPAAAGTTVALMAVYAIAQDWELPLWQALPAKAALFAVAFLPVFLLAGGWQAISELSGLRKRQTPLEGGVHEPA